jgi:hypothetical protein
MISGSIKNHKTETSSPVIQFVKLSSSVIAISVFLFFASLRSKRETAKKLAENHGWGGIGDIGSRRAETRQLLQGATNAVFFRPCPWMNNSTAICSIINCSKNHFKFLQCRYHRACGHCDCHDAVIVVCKAHTYPGNLLSTPPLH